MKKTMANIQNYLSDSVAAEEICVFDEQQRGGWKQRRGKQISAY